MTPKFHIRNKQMYLLNCYHDITMAIRWPVHKVYMVVLMAVFPGPLSLAFSFPFSQDKAVLVFTDASEKL